jgi:hypothetical protein
MKKTEEAKKILKALGLPNAQQNEMAALTLLALCNIKKNNSWENSQRKSLGLTKGIISFVNKNYQKTYAPNTRESFRKDVLHYFVQARIADYNSDNPEHLERFTLLLSQVLKNSKNLQMILLGKLKFGYPNFQII